MKYLVITLLIIIGVQSSKATDPIKGKSFYLAIEGSYTFHDYLKQVSFKKEGQIMGAGLILGHRKFPIYGEYFYQSPMSYRFRNNLLRSNSHEFGLRYNLNGLHYLIPYGVDPYVGASILWNTSELVQEGIEDPNVIINKRIVKNNKAKLSAGVRMGSNNITFGIQYDYLPSKFNFQISEGESLILFDEVHFISVRVGYRFNNLSGNRINCPRFKNKQKRTLRF